MNAATNLRPFEIDESPAVPKVLPRELDITAMSQRAAARPEMLLPALQAMPLGEPTLLAAHGGGFKSTLAVQLLVSCSAGVPFFGEPLRRMRCAYLSFEDPESVLHFRLENACRGEGVPMRDLVGWLRVFDGTTWPGAWYGRDERGGFGLTLDFHAARERIAGSQLIVVDGCADVYAANENDRAQVKAFVRGLRSMVPADGALLLLAHIDKQGVKEGGDAIGHSGSTGWHNSVRSRLFMYRETSKDDGGPVETGNIVLENKKANWGASGGRILLRYDTEYSILRRVDTPITSGTKSRMQRDMEEAAALKTIIAAAHRAGDPIPTATSSTRSAHAVMQARDGFPDALRGKRGKTRFYQTLERMRAAGELRTETLRRSNRHHVDVFALAAPESERASVTEQPAPESERIRARDGT